MRINRLIKCSLISILTLSFVLVNNINLTFACGSLAMAEVYTTLEKISKTMGISPQCFICLLYGGCFNDMNTIEKYTKDIEKNLNNLRDKIGNVEFNNLWNNSVAFEEETEEEIEKRTIGEKLQKLLGLTKDTIKGEVVHEKGTGMVLDKYKKMLTSVSIPHEDEAGYNKLREGLKKEKVKEPLKEFVLPLLNKTQVEVFTNLDKLDEETKKHIKAIKEFHEVEIEEHKKASAIQAICKSRIDLVKENLSDLLGNVEQNLDTLKSITPDNITNSVKCVTCFSKIKQAIMNMSYITMPDYLDRSLERRVQLRTKEPEEGPVADIIKFQRGIGDLQTEVSFLRETIMQLIFEPQEEKISGIDIEWNKPEFATDINGKLFTYSLNQYHFLQKGASAGMDKAYDIWVCLGYTNEDSGLFEAKVRKALIHSSKNFDSKSGNYSAIVPIKGINLEERSVIVVWTYKTFDKTAGKNLNLAYPKCATIYQKEEKKK